jgi:hypothetical protein
MRSTLAANHRRCLGFHPELPTWNAPQILHLSRHIRALRDERHHLASSIASRRVRHRLPVALQTFASPTFRCSRRGVLAALNSDPAARQIDPQGNRTGMRMSIRVHRAALTRCSRPCLSVRVQSGLSAWLQKWLHAEVV